ncbi:hypothetical protein [Synoicihabitans lomoniglobus]|uniref:Chalcone isomerase domain-containing protein n=1 Tax=Synoicihabitans lomoniglobus TaxID=2909285 RepID=A0AAE9ZVH2_9BACT|nr:hypothetical protein [Opitutaceae bacterium LMO-M01]WED63580.1 hypothetical protein PXH66_14685 [Opitutaceae bacterium LMO-M01]
MGFHRLCFAGLISLTSGLMAQESVSAESTPPRVRALSPTVADAVTAALPKFQPNRPDSEADDWDLPEPKNQIIRLPRVVVEGTRPPVFTEREVHTDKGLAELAVKRYFTETGLALNSFTLPLVGMSKEAYAMMLWKQDERLRLIGELSEEADLTEAFGDPDRADQLRDYLNDTLAHPTLFLNPGSVALRDLRGQ